MRLPLSSSSSTARLVRVLAVVAVGCGGAGAGTPCNTDADCHDLARCRPTATLGRSVCMTTCTAGTRLCPDGTVCLDISGALVCYVGGTRSIGDPCSANEQCEPGTVCPTSIGACIQACTVGMDAPCDDDERCEGPSELEGVCREVPDAGAADAGADAGP